MFIRRTKARPTDGGEAYFTYRLVETRRFGRAVNQITLTNLGAHFTVPEAKWPAFVGRCKIHVILNSAFDLRFQRYIAACVEAPALQGRTGMVEIDT